MRTIETLCECECLQRGRWGRLSLGCEGSLWSASAQSRNREVSKVDGKSENLEVEEILVSEAYHWSMREGTLAENGLGKRLARQPVMPGEDMCVCLLMH